MRQKRPNGVAGRRRGIGCFVFVLRQWPYLCIDCPYLIAAVLPHYSLDWDCCAWVGCRIVDRHWRRIYIWVRRRNCRTDGATGGGQTGTVIGGLRGLDTGFHGWFPLQKQKLGPTFRGQSPARSEDHYRTNVWVCQAQWRDRGGNNRGTANDGRTCP